MNRGDMRSELRDRIGDVNSVHWTDATLNRKIDLAAQYVAIQLANVDGTPFGRDTYDVDASGNNQLIPLLGVTDMMSPRELLADQEGVNTRYLDPREWKRHTIRHSSGIDRDGNWLWTMRYYAEDRYYLTATGAFVLTFNSQSTSSLAATSTAAEVQAALIGLSTIDTGEVVVTGDAGGPWTIAFAGAKGNFAQEHALTVDSGGTLQTIRWAVEFIGRPGRLFTLIYNQLVAALTDDAQSYTIVPEGLHERVITHAAFNCLGYWRTANVQFAASYDGTLGREMENMLASRPSPQRVN